MDTFERAAGEPTTPGPPGMQRIPGATTLMGSEDFYPEERPVHRVVVDGFWMDAHPVTAAQFRRFVRETGYVAVAERPLDADQYPDADPDLLVPGSLVVRKPAGPVSLDDYRNWWEYAARGGLEGAVFAWGDEHLPDGRVPRNTRVTTPDGSYDVGAPGEHFPRKVVKGGSHLCAPNYCLRCRPSARQAQTIDTSMARLGFRCVVRPSAPG
jgi:sulfatase modifying factor 1